MSIGEVEIRGHMNGFDHGGQAADRSRNAQPAQRDVRNLGQDALAIILAEGTRPIVRGIRAFSRPEALCLFPLCPA